MAKSAITASEMARLRWKGVPEEERSAQMSAAARKRWGEMTPEERSAEMSRRLRKGWLKRKRKKAAR